jgi:hypothetical protein
MLENKRHRRGTDTAQTLYKVYYLGKSSVEGDPSKRARAHCHIQAWARYRGLVEKYQEGH